MAAQYQFSDVIGVELSAEMAAIARQNINRLNGRRKCQDVRITEADATAYAVPVDSTTFIFMMWMAVRNWAIVTAS